MKGRRSTVAALLFASVMTLLVVFRLTGRNEVPTTVIGVHADPALPGEDWWLEPVVPSAIAPRGVAWPRVHMYVRLSRPDLNHSKWSGYRGLRGTLAAVREKLESWGGHYHLRAQGGEWGRRMSRPQVMLALKGRLPKLLDGHHVAIYSHRKGHVLLIRARVTYYVEDIPDADAAIDRVYSALRSRFGYTWRLLGIFACRRVNFSSAGTWSQHSWGNAMDLTSNDMYTISRWAAAQAEVGKLPIQAVIYNRRQWTDYRPYWQYYGGSNPHTDHVHITGVPYRTGTPPCAS